MNTTNPNELLKRLQHAIATKGDFGPEGEGWLGVEDWAELWKKSRPHTYKILTQSAKLGLMEWAWAKQGQTKKKLFRQKP